MNQDHSSDNDPRTGAENNSRVLRNSILIVVVLVAAAALLRFVPFRIGGAGSAPRTEEYTETVRTAEIDGVSCDVTLLPASDGICRVEYSGSSRYACAAEVKNGTLTVKEKRRVPWIFFLFGGQSAKLTVYLPAECGSLSVDTVSGDLMFPEGFAGEDVVLETVSGNLTADALRCRALTVDTVSGDMELTGAAVDGAASVNAVSGDISLTGLRSGGLAIDTTSGNVGVYDADAGTVSIDTTSGDVNLRELGADSVGIDTTSGDVVISLRSPMNYITSTVSGEVSVPPANRTAGTCRVDTTSGDIWISD